MVFSSGNMDTVQPLGVGGIGGITQQQNISHQISYYRHYQQQHQQQHKTMFVSQTHSGHNSTWSLGRNSFGNDSYSTNSNGMHWSRHDNQHSDEMDHSSEV